MDFIAMIFAEYLFTIPALILVALIGIIWESNEYHVLAAFATAFFGFLLFKTTGVSLQTLGYAAAVYIPIGFVYSFWRYSRFAHETALRMKDAGDNDRSIISTIKPTNNVDSIVIWVIVWPFSAVECMTSDIVHTIKAAITGWMSGVYKAIFKSALKKAGVNIDSGL